MKNESVKTKIERECNLLVVKASVVVVVEADVDVVSLDVDVVSELVVPAWENCVRNFREKRKNEDRKNKD